MTDKEIVDRQYKTIEELKKENAELKKKVEKLEDGFDKAIQDIFEEGTYHPFCIERLKKHFIGGE